MLIAVFLIATTLGINMIVLGIVAAFAVGTALGVSEDDIFAGFPGDLFVILIGVTFLFAIASNNGTVDWLIHSAVKAVGGRTAAIPWWSSSSPRSSPPRARSCRARGDRRADRARLRAAVRHQPGADGPVHHQRRTAGGFSPISVFGSIVNGVVERNDLAENATLLFASSFIFNLLLSVVVFFLFGGRRRRTRSPRSTATAPSP